MAGVHMRKFLPVIAVVAAVLALCGCSFFVTEFETGASDTASDYTYYTSPAYTTAPTSEYTSADTVVPGTDVASSAPAVSTAPTASSYTQATTVPLPTATASAPQSTTASPTTGVSTTAEGEIDLSIQLPDANGTMEVSLDPSNKFIKAVHNARGIDTSLLAAVYSVPESGQNYVFEFTSAGKRTVDDLRRVYLLTADGAITSVAASKNAERENLSATENWFCMNVLIKGMVFKAVEDKLQ